MNIQIKQVIVQTRYWLEHVVIGLNFCPFAKSVFEQGKIHFQVSDAESLECCLENLIIEAKRLDTQAEIATTLLIFTNSLQDFDNFLDVLDIANEEMHEQGYEGVYQLASFHPDYCFAECDADDPENFTNRAPYPIFHLLREQSIESALAQYKNPENIPRNNIRLTREMGIKKMQGLLEQAIQAGKE
ncbi:uncharacterized protein BJAS_P3044 [Bathymodiolus japonicus methanotrophic gill symbiont]|uniref:DUF1415 domain-containing protein n=1 Tax=Bathymodiolus japonicus methanotrophic gill symbiont TaxID=113269 RepID=UPI001B422E5C|nr:DUF1415 domain-containing protein [Bathymodiolus japonicus methanotrophic gill symbiont]GFO72642.1 uncharacterized protein BJAS_P3044 [Bathymodiolus japonicus methanotrophic gill symbiont]